MGILRSAVPRGFSDAIVPGGHASGAGGSDPALDESGPPRLAATNLDDLSIRDPQTTLNYRQLLNVCGSATNAFLNFARSADLHTRRLLFLTPDHKTKHVVAEVLIDDRWVIVDPTYRVMMSDTKGHLLTRKDLQIPAIFEQATGVVPNYPRVYNYDQFGTCRIGRFPFGGFGARPAGRVSPGWEESLDWSLLLERESFFSLVMAAACTLLLLGLRFLLAWHADYRLQIPRFHLREHFLRAGAAFFGTPEIK